MLLFPPRRVLSRMKAPKLSTIKILVPEHPNMSSCKSPAVPYTAEASKGHRMHQSICSNAPFNIKICLISDQTCLLYPIVLAA